MQAKNRGDLSIYIKQINCNFFFNFFVVMTNDASKVKTFTLFNLCFYKKAKSLPQVHHIGASSTPLLSFVVNGNYYDLLRDCSLGDSENLYNILYFIIKKLQIQSLDVLHFYKAVVCKLSITITLFFLLCFLQQLNIYNVVLKRIGYTEDEDEGGFLDVEIVSVSSRPLVSNGKRQTQIPETNITTSKRRTATV